MLMRGIHPEDAEEEQQGSRHPTSLSGSRFCGQRRREVNSRSVSIFKQGSPSCPTAASLRHRPAATLPALFIAKASSLP